MTIANRVQHSECVRQQLACNARVHIWSILRRALSEGYINVDGIDDECALRSVLWNHWNDGQVQPSHLRLHFCPLYVHRSPSLVVVARITPLDKRCVCVCLVPSKARATHAKVYLWTHCVMDYMRNSLVENTIYTFSPTVYEYIYYRGVLHVQGSGVVIIYIRSWLSDENYIQMREEENQFDDEIESGGFRLEDVSLFLSLDAEKESLPASLATPQFRSGAGIRSWPSVVKVTLSLSLFLCWCIIMHQSLAIILCVCCAIGNQFPQTR